MMKLEILMLSYSRKYINDVQVEPQLQPLSGEQVSSGSATGDEARLDIRTRGFGAVVNLPCLTYV